MQPRNYVIDSEKFIHKLQDWADDDPHGYGFVIWPTLIYAYTVKCIIYI